MSGEGSQKCHVNTFNIMRLFWPGGYWQIDLPAARRLPRSSR